MGQLVQPLLVSRAYVQQLSMMGPLISESCMTIARFPIWKQLPITRVALIHEVLNLT